MSKLYIIGDVHGRVERYTRLVTGLPEGSQSLQLGDMGLGFRNVLLPIFDNHKFFRGNHDSPAVCWAHPNYFGDYGYDADKEMFWMAGAWSIDYQMRRIGIDWWENEQLSVAELQDALKLYAESKPKYVVTHEAPASITEKILSASLIANGFPPGKPIYTRTTDYLQQMFEAHQPKRWIFGHYHIDKKLTEAGTEFQCLAELSLTTLEGG